MKRDVIRRMAMACTIGLSLTAWSRATELDTVIARLSARLDPIETFTAGAIVRECG
ncbi:MAG: hypothetical protein GF331_01175 [Chitinivibrionales bacterium]|nr:hypothetical protein [Chitinivibrionales bacterium]